MAPWSPARWHRYEGTVQDRINASERIYQSTTLQISDDSIDCVHRHRWANLRTHTQVWPISSIMWIHGHTCGCSVRVEMPVCDTSEYTKSHWCQTFLEARSGGGGDAHTHTHTHRGVVIYHLLRSELFSFKHCTLIQENPKHAVLLCNGACCQQKKKKNRGVVPKSDWDIRHIKIHIFTWDSWRNLAIRSLPTVIPEVTCTALAFSFSGWTQVRPCRNYHLECYTALCILPPQ
jgi:hypothetical protein